MTHWQPPNDLHNDCSTLCDSCAFNDPTFLTLLPPTASPIFGAAPFQSGSAVVVSERSGFRVVRSDSSWAQVGMKVGISTQNKGGLTLVNVSGVACDENGEHLYVAELG